MRKVGRVKNWDEVSDFVDDTGDNRRLFVRGERWTREKAAAAVGTGSEPCTEFRRAVRAMHDSGIYAT